MPFYDLVCQGTPTHEHIDIFLKMGERPPCSVCGAPTETLWKTAPSVVPDDIPGGLIIRHLDKEPRKYYSHSEIAKAAAAKGVKNIVTHSPDPRSGSDKSPITVRWV